MSGNAGRTARGRLCATLTAHDVPRAHELAARAKDGGADLVEYRLDAMAPEAMDLARLVGEGPLPSIVTFRLPEDGGLRREDEAKRVALLAKALSLGAAYVDIELGREDALASIWKGSAGVAGEAGEAAFKNRLIVSYHNLDETPAGLADVARRIESGPAGVVKLATMARTAADAFRHYEVLSAARKPTVAFAMGELGMSSRVMALRFGAPWTYAALEEGSAAAPGQIALRRMRDELRAHRIGRETSIYGVIGRPVGHSMSPAMLGAAFEAEDFDALYLPFEVDSDPGGFVRRMVELGASGFSVTIPHKVDVMGALDEVEPAARRIGAVNTVLVREGRLVGTNSDLYGALDSIAAAAGGREALAEKRALVIGAGGAARAIVFGLLDAGAGVTLTDVVPEKAEELAAASGAKAVGTDDADPAGFDIVANATPVGMHPKTDACPLDAARLRPGQIVFDAVYNPLETKLLREAGSRGCTTVRGVEMFVRQGARQFELWTGRSAPVDVMRETVLERLS